MAGGVYGYSDVRAHGGPARKGIAEAYLARRVLPADPTLATYVIGVRLDFAGRFFGRGQKVIQRMVALDWPIPCHFVVLEKECKPLRKKLRALPGARLL